MIVATRDEIREIAADVARCPETVPVRPLAPQPRCTKPRGHDGGHHYAQADAARWRETEQEP